MTRAGLTQQYFAAEMLPIHPPRHQLANRVISVQVGQVK